MAFCGVAVAQSQSVLSTGRWWRLSVSEEGVYGITPRDIPALLGVNIDSIAVYGRDGAMLSTENQLTSTADLQSLHVDIRDRNGNHRFDADDELLFFGEGAGGWGYDNELKRWTFTPHAYANENCYYLTVNATETTRIATVPAVEADTVMSTHTVVARRDNDLVNIYQSGQVWLGEKFSTSQPQRSVEVRLPGSGISDVKVRYAVASLSTPAASAARRPPTSTPLTVRPLTASPPTNPPIPSTSDSRPARTPGWATSTLSSSTPMPRWPTAEDRPLCATTATWAPRHASPCRV